MKKQLYLFIFFTYILAVNSPVQAQQTRLTGTITDPDTHQPLVGASVAVKGKITGTVTNGNGKFELNTSVPSTLVISMIGYERQEINVQSAEPLTIGLKESTADLNQVVVSASRIEESSLRTPLLLKNGCPRHSTSSRGNHV